MPSSLLYVGVKAQVVALDPTTGAIRWQTLLKSGFTSGDSFVTLLVQEPLVFAHTYGEVFCLEAETGAVVWNNPLKGFGYGLATLGMNGFSAAPATALAQHIQQRQRQQVATSSGSTSAASSAHP